MIQIYYALVFVSLYKMYADCLYIWTKLDSIMTSAFSRCPMIEKSISDSLNVELEMTL